MNIRSLTLLLLISTSLNAATTQTTNLITQDLSVRPIVNTEQSITLDGSLDILHETQQENVVLQHFIDSDEWTTWEININSDEGVQNLLQFTTTADNFEDPFVTAYRSFVEDPTDQFTTTVMFPPFTESKITFTSRSRQIDSVGSSFTIEQISSLEPLLGDASGDGVVNFIDFIRIARNFGASGKNWIDGDFTLDGVIGFPDFIQLAQNFGARTEPVTVTSVPEPDCSLVVLALVLLYVRASFQITHTYRSR